MYGIMAASVDGQELEVSELDPWSRGINGNPFGMSGGSNAYPALAEIGYAVPDGEEAVFTNLTVKNFRTPCAELFVSEKRADLQGGEKGTMQLINPSHDAMPMLRTEFEAKRKIRQARLYATARGIYELSLNGQKVGEDYFAPGFTQYNKTSYIRLMM